MVKSLFLVIIMGIIFPCAAQESLNGKVVNSIDGNPVIGAIVVLGTSRASTDETGRFRILIKNDTVLKVQHMGYISKNIRIVFPLSGELEITLDEKAGELEEVKISTGYYQQSPEKTTGSFQLLRTEDLQRNMDPNILNRIEGIVPGLLYDRRSLESPGNQAQISLRGLSTLYADALPLIVVDNFPFEGDISQLNPNDVASITILKDAAAASIWGAKAGNGVIVITTKKGSLETGMRIGFTSSLKNTEHPDFFKNPSFLLPADYISVERKLFNSGFYTAAEQDLSKPPLSPVIEMLILHRDEMITGQDLENGLSELGKYDVRSEISNTLYRNSFNQQYALNFSGGGKSTAYYFSGGYDDEAASVVGNDRTRLTFNSKFLYRPVDRLELDFSMSYANSASQLNGIAWNDLQSSAGKSPFPYTRLQDQEGNPLAIVKNYRKSYTDNAINIGLLDWQYKPLEDRANNENKTVGNDIRLGAALKYKILQPLSFDLKYQYQQATTDQRQHYSAESFYVRNLINRYTQSNGVMAFPLGGTLYNNHNQIKAHSFRAQLNYNLVRNDHELNALAGAEVLNTTTMANGAEVYGYDDDVLTTQVRPDLLTRFPILPYGIAQLPLPRLNLIALTDRFVSYFANAAYTYQGKYTFSGSARRDASNLFGVKTNQKAVPLWSAGLGWLISKEGFFRSEKIGFLRLRSTYGYSGNIDKSVTAFPTASYSTSSITGLRTATIISPANTGLRWERVETLNFGVDAASKNGRWKARIEYYIKKGKDLLGNQPLDPTIGFRKGSNSIYTMNYANMVTKGLDAELTVYPVHKQNISWQISLFTSFISNEVTKFNYTTNSAYLGYLGGLNSVPIEGRPRNVLYSYPWIGLDPATGDPLVEIDGVKSKSYSAYNQQLTTDMLIYHGSAVPVVFGSFLNAISYRGLTLSANIIFKGGYYFRRKSIGYEALFSSGAGHIDFYKRWKNTGDEQYTQVPSMPESIISGRDSYYLNSELNVEKGDHVRLQDVNLSYEFKIGQKQTTYRAYVNGNNLGILWRANKLGLDPDLPSSLYPMGKSFTIGVNVNF